MKVSLLSHVRHVDQSEKVAGVGLFILAGELALIHAQSIATDGE